ncbi:MAG: MBOAT family protein [bacterium]
MLFNSYSFLLLFLPVTLGGFWLLGAWAPRSWARCWLVLTSLFFYGWWNPVYLILIGLSMLANFATGVWLSRLSAEENRKWLWLLLSAGLAANLAALGYFKYAAFFARSVNAGLGTHLPVLSVVLPLGISFFTFQQMAYLVDAARGQVREYSLVDYALFVTFFPQLIAGPIVHHADMLPQFSCDQSYRPRASNLSIGLTIFAIGLFKKVVLADGVARFGSPVFAASAAGVSLSFFESWGGALAYTLQLYFDFSGYSDMAIGLGRMFGIRIPLNFNSPYKADSIAEFWKRWHITLSQFLRDYLYISLGGNRLGPARRHVNLLVTMLLGGLWHGAGWTFVIWGGLHGVYLICNHAWRTVTRNWNVPRWASGPGRVSGRLLTFLCVVVGWVFFRAPDLPSAGAVLWAMSGADGIGLPSACPAWLIHLADAVTPVTILHGGPFPNGVFPASGIPWVLGLLVVVWTLPNSIEIMARYRPLTGRAPWGRTTPSGIFWRPTPAWALFVLGAFGMSLLKLSDISEFLYFQF